MNMYIIGKNDEAGKASVEESNKVKVAQPAWPGLLMEPAGPSVDEVTSTIAKWLRVLVAGDQVVELRALKVDSSRSQVTWSGFYDAGHLEHMAREAARLTRQAEGVYFTLNPLNPDLLSRRSNRADVAQEGSNSCDRDVLRRRWLLVDADPVRLSGVSSTDEERRITKEVVSRLRDHLSGAGWPSPVFADSGNGYHLLYRIDLPAGDNGLVKRVLAALARRFDTAEVKIDQKVFNPARIVKLYGTLARKGDDTLERPHRWSAVIEVPEALKVVPDALLEALAKEAPAEQGVPPAQVNRAGFASRLAPADLGALKGRARAYLEKVEPAVSGDNGHNQTFKVACILVCGFGLPIEDALEVIRPWNERCSPPWSEKDLRHKLEDAGKQPGEKGYLVGEAGRRIDEAMPGIEDGKVPAERAEDDPVRLAGVVLGRRFTKGGKSVLRYWQREWWRWEEGAYQLLAEEELRAGVWEEVDEEFGRAYRERVSQQANSQKATKAPGLRRAVNRNIVTNVVDALRSSTIIPSEVRMPGWMDVELGEKYGEVIALRNGLLQRRVAEGGGAMELLPGSPDWFSRVRLPYDFDPGANCPEWRAFLDKNLECDQERIALLQEWFGYCLTPDTGMQRFLMLEGEGANGKSVVCAVLAALLGEANVSHVPLENFGDRFSLAQTLGKLANIASEIGEIDKAAEGYLKGFTSGDRMTFDRKGIAPIEAAPTARLVFATNNRPRFADRSEGVWRRMLIVPFRVTIRDEEKVPGMDKPAYWGEKGELPGIFNWSVEGLKRLRARKRFTVPSVSEDALNDYRGECNPARAFLQEHFQPASKPAESVLVSSAYAMYKDWCCRGGYQPMSDRTFGKEVKRVFGVERKRLSVPPRPYYYPGVEPKEQTQELNAWAEAKEAYTKQRAGGGRLHWGT